MLESELHIARLLRRVSRRRGYDGWVPAPRRVCSTTAVILRSMTRRGRRGGATARSAYSVVGQPDAVPGRRGGAQNTNKSRPQATRVATAVYCGSSSRRRRNQSSTRSVRVVLPPSAGH